MDIDQLRRRIEALEREVKTSTSSRGMPFPKLYEGNDAFLKAPRTLEETLTQQAQGTKAEIALAEVNAIRTEWNELRERLRAKDEQMHLNSDYHQDWDENCHQDWDENCHKTWDENCYQDWDENCHQDWEEDYHQDWDENCHQDWDENCHQDWDENCHQDWTEECHHDWDSGLHCEENRGNCRIEEDAAEGRSLG